MIIYYGYEDNSGEYFITIDTKLCDNCGRCLKDCPQNILETARILDEESLEEKMAATVKEEFRKKIGYVCAACHLKSKQPCIGACSQKAISLIRVAR